MVGQLGLAKRTDELAIRDYPALMGSCTVAVCTVTIVVAMWMKTVAVAASTSGL